MAKATKAEKQITDQQYSAALANYNTAYRAKLVLEQKRDAKLAQLKSEFDKPISEHQEKVAEAEAIISTYCNQNRDSLFGDSQSIKNWLGTIGFRKLPASVVLNGDAVDILSILKKKGLTGFIVVKEDIDKKAIKDETNDKVLKKLEDAGVSIKTDGETFYIKPD